VEIFLEWVTVELQSPPFFVNAHYITTLVFAASLTSAVQAIDRYVTPTGVSSGPGTITAPWNAGYAIGKALPGDTVYFRGGVYANQWLAEILVSGREGAPIVFKNYPGEKPIIDGNNCWKVMANDGAMRGLVTFTNRSYVTFDGFEIRTIGTTNSSDVAAVLIRGTSHHIKITNCSIHGVFTTLATPNGSQGTANGVAVLGTSLASSVNNIEISNCDIYDLKTGWSETVTFNGNVEKFLLQNCKIHDSNNIGVDCIGYEGVAANGGEKDRARNGVIRGNEIYNIDSSKNPAYSGDRSAAGIYVDGGRDIIIERNKVYNCNIGVELGSEKAGTVTQGCWVRNNLLYKNHVAGISFGGDDTANTGGATDNIMRNNTLVTNDTTPSRLGEIVIQCRAVNNVVKQNIIYASTLNRFIGNWTASGTSKNEIDYNTYYSLSGPTSANICHWMWKGTYRQGFGAWKALSGQDAHSIFADPKFTALTGSLNLHIAATSGARDKGDPGFLAPTGELDIDGQARVTDGKCDCGADEYVPPSTTTVR
jgi:hypothetical protein